MANPKLFDNTRVVTTIAPAAARTTSATGTAVDTAGFDNGMVIIQAGVTDFADTTETYVFTVEHSDNGSDGWTAVTGLTASVTAQNTVRYIRLRELNVAIRRHVRVILTIGGATPSILCSVGVALAGRVVGPENDD